MAFTAKKTVSVAAPHTSLDAMQSYSQRQNCVTDRSLYSDLVLFLSKLKAHLANCVPGRCTIAGNASTVSTQATGAAGVTEVRVNLSAFKSVVNGQQKEFTAETDRVLHDTTVYTGADAGAKTTTLTTTNCYAYVTIVAASNSTTYGSGTVSLVNCKGGTATSSALALAARCTDAEIGTKVDTALSGSGLPWVKVADVILYRSADTAISQTYDHTCQPCLGVNVDSDFFGTIPV